MLYHHISWYRHEISTKNIKMSTKLSNTNRHGQWTPPSGSPRPQQQNKHHHSPSGVYLIGTNCEIVEKSTKKQGNLYTIVSNRMNLYRKAPDQPLLAATTCSFCLLLDGQPRFAWMDWMRCLDGLDALPGWTECNSLDCLDGLGTLPEWIGGIGLMDWMHCPNGLDELPGWTGYIVRQKQIEGQRDRRRGR